MNPPSAYNFICQELSRTPGTPYAFQDVRDAGRQDVLYSLLHGQPNALRTEQLTERLTSAMEASLRFGDLQADLEKQLRRTPLALCADALMRRLRILLQEGQLDSGRLYRLGLKLAKEHLFSDEVKLGMLILGLFENDIVRSILRTLSLHSEFTLYGIEAVQLWPDGNRIIADFARNTTGYGRLAAIHRLQPVLPEQQQWLLEHGMENPVARQLTASFLLEKPDMRACFERNAETASVHYARLIAYAAEGEGFQKLASSRMLAEQYTAHLAIAEIRFIDLAAVVMLLKQLPSRAPSEESSDKTAVWPLETELQIRDRCHAMLQELRMRPALSKSLFSAELADPHEDASLIIAVLDVLESFPDWRLPDFDAFQPLLQIDGLDLDVMNYLLVKHPQQYVRDVHECIRFEDALFSGPEIIDENRLTPDNRADIWLESLLHAMSADALYDEAFCLRCLNARYQGARAEAVSALQACRAEWSDAVVPALKAALEREPSSRIRQRMHRLLGSGADRRSKERRRIDVGGETVSPTPADECVLQTTIAGAFYRDLSVVQDQVAAGDALLLRPEPDNPHDKFAILVATKDGYVLGYIPRTENEALCALLNAGVRLYAVLLDSLESHGSRPGIAVMRPAEVVKGGNIVPFPKMSDPAHRK